MQNKVTYEYAVIRVVPKVEREEFMNVGVIVFSKRKRYLGIKYHINEARLRAFSNKLDIDLIRKYLHAWECVCKGGKAAGKMGEEELPFRFRWLAAPKSTIIQSSGMHPGLCENPEAVLEELFEFYVS